MGERDGRHRPIPVFESHVAIDPREMDERMESVVDHPVQCKGAVRCRRSNGGVGRSV